MSHALSKFVCLACAAAVVSAHAGTAAEADAAPLVMAALKPSAESLGQTGPGGLLARPAAGNSASKLAASTATSADDDRTTLGTLLATLVLMLAIAVRRHRAGKS